MRIVTILGARPQFIKLVPLSRAMPARKETQETMSDTGLHCHASLVLLCLIPRSAPVVVGGLV